MIAELKRRPVRLLFPELQRNLVLLLLLSSGVSVILHVTVSAWTLTRLIANAPNDAEQLLGSIPGILVSDIAITLLVALPLFSFLGLLASMPLFGALYRFRSFLEGVRGGKAEPCQLRQGDPLQEMCALLNDVTAPLRSGEVTNAKNVEESSAASQEELGEAA